MMKRVAAVVAGAALALAVGAGPAGAQQVGAPFGPFVQPGLGGAYGGYGGYPSFGGGAMNPYFNQPQTLSPYLNLSLGRSAAVNYFNAVRPAQVANNLFSPTGPLAGGLMQRQAFFPNAVDDLDQLDASVTPNTNETNRMAPTGHPTGFSNTLGYVGPAGPQNVAGGQHRPQPGLSNFGSPATQTPQPRR
jgi:hypothetical protein